MSRVISDFQTAVIHKQQHLQLAQPALGAYRGGSLPNVNQTVDLQVGIVTVVSIGHFLYTSRVLILKF